MQLYILVPKSLSLSLSLSLSHTHTHTHTHTYTHAQTGESSNVELTNLEKCLSVIIESLKQQNPQLVKAVEDLVAELCRITLLWDEMWLAALMQRQGEVHRYILQHKKIIILHVLYKGSPHTSQIIHLLLYPSLWLLVPGLCSQFLPLFPIECIQPAFNDSSGQQFL